MPDHEAPVWTCAAAPLSVFFESRPAESTRRERCVSGRVEEFGGQTEILALYR